MRGGLTALVASCVLALLAFGCGGGSSDEAAPQSPSRKAQQQEPEQAPPEEAEARARRIAAEKAVPTPWKRPPPTIRAHPGAKGIRLRIRELRRGTGPVVRTHDFVLLDYVIDKWRSGVRSYGAWGAENGTGVILTPTERWRGLVAGMQGMRVGGRRQILAPAGLSGTLAGHGEYNMPLYWDVVLRGIYARGCADDGEPCRSGP